MEMQCRGCYGSTRWSGTGPSWPRCSWCGGRDVVAWCYDHEPQRRIVPSDESGRVEWIHESGPVRIGYAPGHEGDPRYAVEGYDPDAPMRGSVSVGAILIVAGFLYLAVHLSAWAVRFAETVGGVS